MIHSDCSMDSDAPIYSMLSDNLVRFCYVFFVCIEMTWKRVFGGKTILSPTYYTLNRTKFLLDK